MLEISKVVDETDNSQSKIPETEEYKNLNKIIAGSEIPKTTNSPKQNQFKPRARDNKKRFSKAETDLNTTKDSKTSKSAINHKNQLSKPRKMKGNKVNQSFSHSKDPKSKNLKNLAKVINHKRSQSRAVNNEKDQVTSKILQKLYRLHKRFQLVISEDFQVHKYSKNYESEDMDSHPSSKHKVFNFGEKPELEEYDGRVERKIVQLNDKDYKDK